MTKALNHERNDTIDTFRSISILSVIGYHYSTTTQATGIGSQTWAIPQLGRYGVYLFFIISGLVIAMTLERSKNALDFAIKRFSRIYPAFLAAMLTTAAVGLAFPLAYFHIHPIDYLLNLSPYNFGFRFHSVDPSYWSLTPEIQFYAYAAIFFAALRERFWVGLLGVALLSIPLRRHHFLADNILLGNYMPMFLAGIGAWLAFYRRKREGYIVLAASVALYALVAGRLDTFPHTYVLWMAVAYLVGLGSLMLGLVAFKIRIKGWFLADLGRRSYSLYLLHQVIGETIINRLHGAGVPALLAAAIAVAASIGLAFLYFELFEERASRVLRKWLEAGLRFPRSRHRELAPAE